DLRQTLPHGILDVGMLEQRTVRMDRDGKLAVGRRFHILGKLNVVHRVKVIVAIGHRHVPARLGESRGCEEDCGCREGGTCKVTHISLSHCLSWRLCLVFKIVASRGSLAHHKNMSTYY